MTVIHLATSQQRPVHACGSCRFYTRQADERQNICSAFSNYAEITRKYDCHGNYWEPLPPAAPFVPIFVRLKRWLVG